uniref:Secreted protein n=1 Tax=Steinernema glaseri TaxID=37863 RepID=A0A1I8AGK3_9BILA
MRTGTCLVSIVFLQQARQCLQPPEHGQDDEHENQRIGRAHLNAHRGVAVRQSHRQGTCQRCMQHPGQVELAQGQGENHQTARHNRGQDGRQQDAEKDLAEVGAQGSGGLFQIHQAAFLQGRACGAHHKGQSEHNVAYQNEPEALAKTLQGAVGQQQSQRGGHTGNGYWQGQQFLEGPGQARATASQCVGAGHAKHDDSQHAQQSQLQR